MLGGGRIKGALENLECVGGTSDNARITREDGPTKQKKKNKNGTQKWNHPTNKQKQPTKQKRTKRISKAAINNEWTNKETNNEFNITSTDLSNYKRTKMNHSTNQTNKKHRWPKNTVNDKGIEM